MSDKPDRQDDLAEFRDLAEHLDAMDDAEWGAVQTALLTATAYRLNPQSSNLILDRLQTALGEERSAGSHLWATNLVLLVATGEVPHLDAEQIPQIFGDRAVRWLRLLRRSFGDWLSDMIRADVEGFRTWNRVYVTSHQRTDHRDNRSVKIEIHLIDGSVVDLEMSPTSAIRFASSLTDRLADLPPEYLATTASHRAEYLRSAKTLTDALTENDEAQDE